MVEIKNNKLVIKTGDNYYDTNEQFHIPNIISLTEERGVRGGHVGWLLDIKNGKKTEQFDFGRKIYHIMEMVKELINNGHINAEIIIKNNTPQRGY